MLKKRTSTSRSVQSSGSTIQYGLETLQRSELRPILLIWYHTLNHSSHHCTALVRKQERLNSLRSISNSKQTWSSQLCRNGLCLCRRYRKRMVSSALRWILQVKCRHHLEYLYIAAYGQVHWFVWEGQIFSTIYAYTGYWEMKTHKEDRPKTCFCVSDWFVPM